MPDTYSLNEVFTPSSPATVTFVERESVNDRIVRALDIVGMQIVIYGHTGTGKTTLLENKLFQTYEKHIRSSCMKGMTFDQILFDAFDQLSEFYVDEITNSRKESINAKTKAFYLAISAESVLSVETNNGVKQKRVVPPQLTAQSLARLMGDAGYCWVIEDFHKIDGEHKLRLAQMMKVFMDESKKYKDLKIIATGAVNTAREVVQYDEEMKQRVTEIRVELMSAKEIKEIITKGCDALNISIAPDLKDEIAHYSSGIAAACHKICYILCDAALVKTTMKDKLEFSHDDLQNALSEYLEDTSDTIKCAFDKALNLKGSENVLWSCAELDSDGNGAKLDDFIDCIHKNHSSKLSEDELKEILDRLCSEEHGSSIKYDKDSARYSFANPFLCSFARTYFEEKAKTITGRISAQKRVELLNKALMNFMRANVHAGQASIAESDDEEPLTDGRE